jgi:hypothetical protein
MIRTGQRKNADSEMVKQIEGFGPGEQSAVLDYTARLRPPADKLAEDGWTNPDFPHYVRDALGIRAVRPVPGTAPAQPAAPSADSPAPAAD